MSRDAEYSSANILSILFTFDHDLQEGMENICLCKVLAILWLNSIRDESQFMGALGSELVCIM